MRPGTGAAERRNRPITPTPLIAGWLEVRGSPRLGCSGTLSDPPHRVGYYTSQGSSVSNLTSSIRPGRRVIVATLLARYCTPWSSLVLLLTRRLCLELIEIDHHRFCGLGARDLSEDAPELLGAKLDAVLTESSKVGDHLR